MDLFIAFVVVVLLIGFGFGRIMAKVLLVTVGIPAAIILLIIIIFNGPWAKAWGTSSAPTEVSSRDCSTPAEIAAGRAAKPGSYEALDALGAPPCAPESQASQAAPATPSKPGSYEDLLALATPVCDPADKTDLRCKARAAPIERSSDPYQKALQALTGEKLTPLN